MVFYIAAHSQEDAKKVAKLCIDAGHTVNSRWILEDFSRTSSYTDVDKTNIAHIDYDDVVAADALILLSSPFSIPGGKFVEVGIALASHMPVYLLGHRENMLMWHISVQQFDSAENLLKYLA